MASQKSRNYVYVATITQGLEDLAIDELKEVSECSTIQPYVTHKHMNMHS